MAGPEATDWLARINRELEPLQHAWQRLQPGIEQFSKQTVAARAAWQQLQRSLEQFSEQTVAARATWRRLSRVVVAARDRGDFRRFKSGLQLTAWMLQEIEAAKRNPSHRRSRLWLAMQHRSPKEIAEALPYLVMLMPELRIPERRGRPRRPAANTSKMVERLDRRIKRTGERPTTAARNLLSKRYHGETLKGKADHLVRLWKKRAFKSR
jgi:hypothetical protein